MMFGGGMLLGGLLPLILLIAGGVWLFNNAAGKQGNTVDHSPRADESPEEILRRRLAQGEISLEEYDEMRQTLQQ